MGGPRIDRPRTNRDPAELARKRQLLAEPRMAALVDHVAHIRADRGADRMPDFDPTEATTAAPILLLLEAPGPKATRERGGSGFVSPDNNDGTAENMWHLLRDASIDRATDVVTWNVVPWYIGDDHKIRPADSRDLLEGRPYIEELIRLLTHLKVVVLLGQHARHGWDRLGFPTRALATPHPSPTNLNTRPHYRAEVLETLHEARRIAYSDGRP
jgi:uracil-DNA glycosylase